MKDYGYRILYSLLVGVIGALFYYLFSTALSKANITTGFTGFWFSIIAGLACGILYDIHNTCLGKRLLDLAVKEINPILAASTKIPGLKDYVNALRAVSRFDKVVIARVLSNHSELLAKNRYLMSFDGYLALLTELLDRYSSMVCVNRTLPINWLAPIHGKDSSTRNYEAHLLKEQKNRNFKMQRLTIASKDVILEQLSETYKSLRRSETEPLHCVLWFLELFQALFDNDQDDLITQVSKYFEQYESKVKEILLLSPDQATVGILLPDIAEVCAHASEQIEKEFIYSDVMCKILNNHILKKFFAVHGRSGSYYMGKKTFEKELKKTLSEEYRDVSEYGEIAMYYHQYNQKCPKMAIATVGELGELVRIEIAKPSDLAVCIIKCIKNAEDLKEKDFAGNLEDLITNET